MKKYCKKCNKSYDSKQNFCPECGNQLSSEDSELAEDAVVDTNSESSKADSANNTSVFKVSKLKIAAGIVLLVFVGAGIGVGIGVITSSRQPVRQNAQQQSVDSGSKDSSGPSDSSDSSGSSSSDNSKSDDASKENQMKQAVYEQYSNVTDNASNYFSELGLPNKSVQYEYSLVYMDPKNPQIPQLLLKQKYEGEMSRIVIFNFDESGSQAFKIQTVLAEGAASAGGSRASLQMKNDRSGLIATVWHSVTGEANMSRYVVSGHGVSSTTEWEGKIDQAPKDSTTTDIDWYLATDKSGLDQLK